ncbi:hypothetical protein GGR56DRAFT_397483 [Xylariaceae sp. FL0804]|nr:hypothetical protein GGR56DRAFT_397483 [Xylariaceae sp. FL0804]
MVNGRPSCPHRRARCCYLTPPAIASRRNSSDKIQSKPQFYHCSLCDNTRKDPEHLPNNRFRTSESATAQRYPLCKFCLHVSCAIITSSRGMPRVFLGRIEF